MKLNRYLFEVTYLNDAKKDVTLHAKTLSDAWAKIDVGRAKKVVLLEADNIDRD